jgi:hypothetical protein
MALTPSIQGLPFVVGVSVLTPCVSAAPQQIQVEARTFVSHLDAIVLQVLCFYLVHSLDLRESE